MSFQVLSKRNVSNWFNFSNLTSGTQYYFYFGLLKDDPSPYWDYEPKIHRFVVKTGQKTSVEQETSS